MDTIKSQNVRILEYLKAGNKITQEEARALFSCWRLSGRIFDLKENGHNIKADLIVQNGKRFAQYSYVPPKSTKQLVHEFCNSADKMMQLWPVKNI